MPTSKTTYYLALDKATKDKYNWLVLKGIISKAVMANRLRQCFMSEIDRAELARKGTKVEDVKIFGNDTDSTNALGLVKEEGSMPHIEESNKMKLGLNKISSIEGGFTESNFSEIVDEEGV